MTLGSFPPLPGLRQPAELRSITRAHVIAWRKHLESRELAPSSIRRKLSALSALFDYLCERNAVVGNPIDGVKRPMSNNNEGSTPALGDAQVRKLLDAPPADTLKGVRDRAILATLLYHGIRREKLCGLRVKDMQSRQGVLHFRVKGKRGKVRFVPVQVLAQRLIEEYLALAGHAADTSGPVFRPVTNKRTGDLDRPLDPASVYQNIVRKYALETGISAQVNGLCVHRCAPRRPPMPSHTRRISPRFRSGSATRTSPRHGSTTGAKHGPRTAQCFVSDISVSSESLAPHSHLRKLTEF
jgi:integrase/recombinase XerD